MTPPPPKFSLAPFGKSTKLYTQWHVPGWKRKCQRVHFCYQIASQIRQELQSHRYFKRNKRIYCIAKKGGFQRSRLERVNSDTSSLAQLTGSELSFFDEICLSVIACHICNLHKLRGNELLPTAEVLPL